MDHSARSISILASLFSHTGTNTCYVTLLLKQPVLSVLCRSSPLSPVQILRCSEHHLLCSVGIGSTSLTDRQVLHVSRSPDVSPVNDEHSRQRTSVGAACAETREVQHMGPAPGRVRRPVQPAACERSVVVTADACTRYPRVDKPELAHICCHGDFFLINRVYFTEQGTLGSSAHHRQEALGLT